MIKNFHSNRRAHNWLIYDIGDKFLNRHKNLYKGVLYDLGCGDSPYRNFFLHFAESYTGVDWPSSPHEIKAKVIADLNDVLPIESGIADTVISISVLEHLHNPQLMISESYRILKDGGYIVLQVPFQWWIHEAPYDYFRYTPFGLKYIFEKSGFLDVTIEPQSGFFSMWFLKFNYFTLRFIRGPKILRTMIRFSLYPLWYFLQRIAPFMDRFDDNWQLETIGFFVVARK